MFATKNFPKLANGRTLTAVPQVVAEPSTPRILIVDAHGVYRTGLRLGLQTVFSGSQIIEADNLKAARKLIDADRSLDLVVVDVDAPDASLDVLRSLRESHPGIRFVAISVTTTRAFILRSLEYGLFGFISKSQSDQEIFSAIRDILSGRIYVPSSLSQLNELTRCAYSSDDHQAKFPSVVSNMRHPGKLTRRQQEILPLLAKGMSNKEIARALNIAEGTTKIHASGLLRVLGVRNRTEAAILARDYILSQAS
jgi:DNA-binding NarL/FixJ family response regulator